MAERVAALPRISRARGFHLYDAAGRRYLDLWLAGGGAFVGHRPAGVTSAVTAALARGLASGLPSAWEDRLARMLVRLLTPWRAFRVFPSRERALAAAGRWLGRGVAEEEVADPALGPVPPNALIAFWRPGLPLEPCRLLLPALPWTLDGSPAALGFPEEPDLASEPVAPAVLAGALRGLAAYLRGRSDPIDRGVAAAGGWRRRGPYVAPLFASAAWPEVATRFRERGVLLPPRHPGPAILPGEASPGERRLLTELFRTVSGG